MHALWTTSQELEFHQAIVGLSKLRQTLREEISYRENNLDTPQSPEHVFRFEDELQLADHIAYLAHSSEGPLKIAAACIEEQQSPPGLVLRIARNKLRSDKEVQNLSELLQLVERCAREDVDAIAAHYALFTKVLDMSEPRLLQRIMPPWHPPPPHWTVKQKEKRTSLYHRIETVLLPELEQKIPSSLHWKLSQVMKALEPLETKKIDSDLRELVRSVVLSCIDICAGTENKSLELYLGQSLDMLPDIGRKTVFQIDKIARYFNLCKDLVKMIKNKKYRHMFQHISLESIMSDQLLRREGSTERCITHAEVQLILCYERTPVSPLPRALGCSKSAYFLCDLLVRYHGKFRISLSHQRIYPKWTIPNNNWMTVEQVNNWRGIITSMTRGIQWLIQKYKMIRENALSAPVESKACLPLVSVVNSAETLICPGINTNGSVTNTNGPITDTPISDHKESLMPRSTTPLELSAKVLPVTYKLSTACPDFRLILGSVTVIFEYSRGFTGTICLKEPVLPSPSIPGFDIEDLSCADDRKIAPNGANESLALMFRAGGKDILQVEVMWS